MHRKNVVVASLILITLFLIASSRIASVSSLNLTVILDKQVYNGGNTVRINGNLTNDGLPVTEAIVAVEVDDPEDDVFVIRTMTARPIDQTQ